MAPIAIPTFTYGTYTSMDGTPVTFTRELMQQLERNTNFALKIGVLTPTVGYDHPVYGQKDTDAHGNIAGVRFVDGVVYNDVDKPSAKFVADTRAGRRLRVSGEYVTKFPYVDEAGVSRELGPTIVGLAALGRNRPAIKNPKIVPLSALPFGESVDEIDAYAAREELRKAGVIAHTFDGAAFAFSEIEVDPLSFGEPKTEDEMPLTADEMAQLKQMFTSVAEAAVAPIKTAQAAIETQINAFSEAGKRETAALAFMEGLKADGKVFGQTATREAIAVLSDPTIPTPALTQIQSMLKSFGSVLVPGGVAGKKKAKPADEDDDDDTREFSESDEPAALAVLRPKHFDNVHANETKLEAGLVAFGELQPKKLQDAKGAALPFEGQIAALKAYVVTREASA